VIEQRGTGKSKSDGSPFEDSSTDGFWQLFYKVLRPQQRSILLHFIALLLALVIGYSFADPQKRRLKSPEEIKGAELKRHFFFTQLIPLLMSLILFTLYSWH